MPEILRTNFFLKNRFISLTSLFVMALLVFSCGELTERDNPVDPSGTNYTNKGTLVVHVRDSYTNNMPGVSVTLPDLNLAFITGSDGMATIEVAPGTYTCNVEREGFKDQQFTETIEFQNTKTKEISLNALPMIDSVWTVTELEQVSIDNYFYHYTIFAKVYDYDENIGFASVRYYEQPGEAPDTLDPGAGSVYSLYYDYNTDLDSFSSLFNRPLRLVIIDDESDSTDYLYTMENFFYYDNESIIQADNDFFNTDSIRFEWANPRYRDWHHWFYAKDFRIVARETSSQAVVEDTLLHFNDEEITALYLSYTLFEHTVSAGTTIDFYIYIYDPNGNFVRTPEYTRQIAQGS